MKSKGSISAWFGLFLLLNPTTVIQAQDLIEFLNGSRLSGKVIAIHKADRQVEFATRSGQLTRARRYPYSQIHRVIWNDKEYVVTPKGQPADTIDNNATTRSAAEVKRLVQSVGSTPPAWMETTPLNYPPTLDLDWPLPAPKPWNNRKNMGQYIWDRINPNANRWKSGIRLMVSLQERHRDRPALLKRVNGSLAAMYFRFFQDYARAGYWWQEIGVTRGSRDAVGLAECYYRLGCKSLALEMLSGGSTTLGKIKLLGEMDETSQALQLADRLGPRSSQPHEIYLTAGDICKRQDRFDDAIQYYEKVLSAPPARNEAYSKRFRGRAADSIEAIKRFELLQISDLADGTYRGSSLGYEAPIHIEAKIAAGRIVALEVTQHKEKQYYSAIRDVPQQIVKKQTVKDIDATSRATITAVAIINATAKALTDRPASP